MNKLHMPDVEFTARQEMSEHEHRLMVERADRMRREGRSPAEVARMEQGEMSSSRGGERL